MGTNIKHSSNNNRWIYILTSFFINFSLGIIFTWSIFRPELEKVFSATPLQSLLPYMTLLITFVLSYIITARLIKHLNVKMMTFIGSFIFCLGWFLAGFTNNIIIFALVFGIIGGIGNGILLNCSICLVTKWYPYKAGFALGISLIGIAVAPLIAAPLAHELIKTYGVLNAFKFFAVGIFILLCILSILNKIPPHEWRPAHHSKKEIAAIKKIDRSTINNEYFVFLWICYFIAMFCGITIIGITNSFGIEEFHISPKTGAISIAIFSIFASIARPVFGYLIEQIGVRKTSFINFAILFIATLFLLFFLEKQDLWVFITSFSVFWACFNGWQVIGLSHKAVLKINHFSSPVNRIILTAFAFAALLGNILVGYIRDTFGTYDPIFYINALLIAIAMVMVYFKFEKNKY